MTIVYDMAVGLKKGCTFITVVVKVCDFCFFCIITVEPELLFAHSRLNVHLNVYW